MVNSRVLRWWTLWTILLPVLTTAVEMVQGPDVQILEEDKAVVQWTTDVATRGIVRYGLVVSNLNQSAQGEIALRHAVPLTGLRPDRTYFFSVETARIALTTNSFRTTGTASLRERPVSKASNNADRSQAPRREVPSARETWGNPGSLRDHFERHGADFKAKDAEDYAGKAWEFLRRARSEGLPAKVDDEGTIRIYDPKSGAFAAYNRNGTTKTFFKPRSQDYFERQPGRKVNAKTLKF